MTDPGGSAGSDLRAVFAAALKLGLTSFGGPIAHIGYFREEYVVRRRWLDERAYADLVALCQFLPGPASSQVGIGVGTMRAGPLGGLIAWLGFTLPSAIALTLFAFLVEHVDISNAGWLHGLKIVAVAVVAQAVIGMGRNFSRGVALVTITVAAALISLLWSSALSQVLVIAAAGLAGARLFSGSAPSPPVHGRIPISRQFGAISLALFGILLLASLLPGWGSDDGASDLVTSFYRVGSLVFGGGHVVLPLLRSEVVPTGWMSDGQFLAGYGAAQAVPGPLFTFTAYLGAVRDPSPNGVVGSAAALTAIFLPALLLIYGALPFWEELRSRPVLQSALRGVNAAVVGILLAALYDPVWTTAILRWRDFALALLCFGLLMVWKRAPWQVVIVALAGGELLSRI